MTPEIVGVVDTAADRANDLSSATFVNAAQWPCCLDLYVPEGWEPQVLSTSGEHRTVILNHGRRCMVFAPVGELLCYSQQAVDRATLPGDTQGIIPDPPAPPIVVRVEPEGVVRVPDTVLDTVLSSQRFHEERKLSTESDYRGDLGRADLGHEGAILTADLLAGPEGPPVYRQELAPPTPVPSVGRSHAHQDSLLPFNALALLAASSWPQRSERSLRRDSRQLNSHSGSSLDSQGLDAWLVPGSDRWMASVLEVITGDDEELDIVGCLVPIRLVRLGLALSRSDRARLHAVLHGPMAARAQTLRRLVSDGRSYLISQRGRRKRIVGVDGIVQDPATYKRLLAAYAAATPLSSDQTTQEQRIAPRIATPV